MAEDRPRPALRRRTGRVLVAAAVAVAAATGSAVAWSLGSPPTDDAPATASDPGLPDAAAPDAPDGAALFQSQGCTACHLGPDGTGVSGVGPDLPGLAARAGDRVPGLSAEEYVAESIRSPSAFVVPGSVDMMPTFELTDEKVDALVAYLLQASAE